jgi:two-component system, OmpR family, response regulator RegX3
MHIALLEDEPTLAQEVKSLLTGAGHTVVHFADGHAIIQGLLKDTFDLFVLDWHVPEHEAQLTCGVFDQQ